MVTQFGSVSARTFRSLRRHRNYRLFFAGQVVSVAGSWMQNTALVWLVIELRGSPLAVGGLAFARFLPFLALGLFAGVLTDRVDTWRLVVATQVAAALVAVGLAALTLSDFATLPLVYVLATLGGVVLVFDAPARHALTFQMVGPAELQNAVALNAGLFNASRVIGPALAGVVIAAVGTGWCFVINTVSFAAVFVALQAMRVDELEPVVRHSHVRFLSGLREALGWVRTNTVPRVVLTTIAALSLLGFNFHVVIPLLAADTLHVGPRGLGALSAAFGLGALVGALAAAWLRRSSIGRMLAATTGFVVVLLILAPITNSVAAGVVLVLLGGAFVLMTTTANALVQLAAPPQLRGRIIAIYLFCFAGLTPIGGLLAGVLAQEGGTRLAFGTAGALGLVTVAWAYAASRHETAASPTTN